MVALQGFEPPQRVLSTTVDIRNKYSLGEEWMTLSQSSYPLSSEKSGKAKWAGSVKNLHYNKDAQKRHDLVWRNNVNTETRRFQDD